jgi:serine/threonine-protein kinase
MGEVYRARDERLQRDVALKILSTDLSGTGEPLRRFEQEARAASALNHPNIITIYDIGRVDAMAYIAMELIDGRDMRSLLSGDRLQLKNALRIAVKVADGLATAHDRGIVHRDLKPENVMVNRDGFVKILDFGLAKLVRPFTDTDTTLPHTTPGAVFGTVGYMSPEQASGRDVDYRSDQFALGVILYEMVAGRLPFSAPTAAETLALIIRTDAPPVSHHNDAVPAELVRIIDRCLAKDRDDRYASTRDLARDLREVRDRITNITQPRQKSGGVDKTGGRRIASIAAAAVAATAVVAALVMNFRQASLTPPPASGPKAVAIFGFRDMSGDPDGQIFADGVTEMVSAQLVQSKQVRVIPAADDAARTGDTRKVARERGATLAVRGSVQRIDERVQVSFAVIDVVKGEQVGGDVIAGTFADGFGLQSKIVDGILSSLQLNPSRSGDPVVPSELAAADSSAYIQAVGLLQRSRDEQSVDRAITTLRGLLLNARDSALVNAQLARALLNKSQLARRPGLVEEATVYAERATELDPDSPEVHVRLGQVRTAAGRFDDAERAYVRALSLRRDYPDAILGLAAVHESKGRAAQAEEMYRKAIDLRPDHANTFNRYAVFLYNSGRYPEAATNFRRFNELLTTARGFSNLAAAEWAMGRYDDARRAAQRSIELEPTGDAYINLGSIEYYSGAYPNAVNAFEKATQLAPASYAAWVGLGDTYRWSPGLQSKAADAYRTALEQTRRSLAVNPREHAARAAAAICFAKTGRINDAATEINAALKLNPTDPVVLYDAAVVALLRETPDVAVTWLERAVGAGYSSFDLQRDPEFKAMRDDAAFRRAIAKPK